SATTNEMTRNVSAAARGSNEITQNINGVAQAAQNTSSSVHETMRAVEKLAKMSSKLSGLVDQFKVAEASSNNGHGGRAIT
ncbi:MAG: hypothetical protein WA821_15475, partial [Anaerolineales bacterium]